MATANSNSHASADSGGGSTASASGAVQVAQNARQAALKLQALPLAAKNQALDAVRRSLLAQRDAILAANERDCAAARATAREAKLSWSVVKRLELSGGGKFDALLGGVEQLVSLPDPVGRVTLATELSADGLALYRVTCPIGVLCVIFEARPDAAVQIGTLGLKSANAVVLKGGREASRTNGAIVAAMRAGISDALGSAYADAIQLVTTRSEIGELLQLDQYLDLVIPRGSNQLVRYIQQNTSIPVLGHADGICACYLDASADADKAVRVVVDSKTHYAAACNAIETLLCHRAAAENGTLARVARALLDAGVELRADERAMAYLKAAAGAQPGAAAAVVKRAADADFDTEFLAFTIAVKLVDDIDAAIAHVNEHGSHHTESIITEDEAAAERYMMAVDAAGVYHNASTRFADGFRYGFGAEVGVSTNRIHARGPVGMEGLVIYKYRVYGDGHTAQAFSSGEQQFTHVPIRAKHRPEWCRRG